MSLRPTKKKPIPSQDYLKTKLSYNPDTGELHWLKNGKLAGSLTKAGYIRIGLGPNNDRYFAHCLAWMLMTGEDIKEIDHIDLNKSNNKWENLRPITRTYNQANKSLQKNNTSGYKGVCWHKENQKWQVRVAVHGVVHLIGYFDDKMEAVKAREDASIRLHGEYARQI